MTDEDEATRRLTGLTERLPGPVRRGVAWLLEPRAKWLRVPAAVLLIAGGLVGFLPILGFWMVPLGALLLARDFAFVRRPTLRAINAVERWWRRWRSRRP